MLLFSFQGADAVTPKKWTFLIFLNGDNGLDSAGLGDLLAMEKVGSDDQVNIVVQWASLSARKTVRLLIKKSNDPTRVTSPVIQDLGLIDMGDYHNLQEFIRWGVENFPAEHYFVNVWNHGGGWHVQQKQNLQGKQTVLNDISYDDISGNFFSTKQLGSAMTYAASVIGHPVDIYGSDACQMAMIEVADEMPSSVEYYAGSEFVEISKGWPYAEFLARWESTPDVTAAQVSKMLTEEYIKSYEGGSGGTAEVTFSVFRMEKLAAVVQAFKKISDEIRVLSPGEKAKVLSAAKDAQQFFEGDYRDVGDFLSKVQQAKVIGIPDDDINQVQSALHEFVIANGVTPFFSDAKGVSMWLPVTYYGYHNYADRYTSLAFDQETQWGATLKYLLQP